MRIGRFFASSLLLAFTACFGLVANSPADESKPAITAFLGAYCQECHGAEKQKGDRRFDQLSLPATHQDTLIDLQDIIDQLNLGEMPPKKSKQPSETEKKAIIAALTRHVADGRAQLASTGGETVLRRLNRREYLNTVGDLFALNMTMFDPAAKFPRDQMAGHMDNLGDVLVTSGYLLDQYFNAADMVVEKALGSLERPAEQTWVFNKNFRQQPELDYSHGKIYGFRYLCVYETPASERHEGGYAAIREFSRGVPADGWYEIKVQAEAMNRRHPYEQRIFGMDPEEPFRLGIVPGNQSFGALHNPQPIEPVLGEAVIGDNGPVWYTFKVWLDKGFTPRFIFPNGMIDGRRAFTQILNRIRPQLPEEVKRTQGIFEGRPVVLKHGKMPHIRIHEVQVRGPLIEQWPSPPQHAVLGGKPFEPGRTREILEQFASRAYRRPAKTEEVDRLMNVVTHRIKDGHTPFEAMKDGLKAALCSPGFLYLAVPAANTSTTKAEDRPLPAYELASRLSYFLWSSTPDAELIRAAESGDLLKSEVLLAQTRRLLASPRADEFVKGFLDGWLNLRSLGDMPPERNAFERYYTQDLQNAMKQETRLFTRHLLDKNESIVCFLESDFTFINRPLAKLYGMSNAIPAEGGHIFRQVKLESPNRGGLLGQGSVLTVTANGIETSPVIRGVWLLENILGTPPSPPPDNVPTIDPDVRGAKSIRDILTKHRDNAACFECHQKIDPLGFALENFDPIGAWRGRYENGRGPAINSSGELPGGESFENVAGLKKVLVGRKDLFTKMLTERVLGYACGRRIEPLDRPQVDQVVQNVKTGGYGLRTLVEQVVLSDTFRRK